ncbi:hypothetical protein CP969_01370 [Streptomyces viridosporus T7A]|uniref:Uncharacterized protein n=1 Tax=Streptomyces viridosporus T7A TaxID=665577 RepID=A0ABX6A9F9_STRVD|nr:hypothetical protein CP969_01370 [Streptomyces viridosporus T7A]
MLAGVGALVRGSSACTTIAVPAGPEAGTAGTSVVIAATTVSTRIGGPDPDELPAHRSAGLFHRLERLGRSVIDLIVGPHVHDAASAVGQPHEVVRRMLALSGAVVLSRSTIVVT